MRRLLAAIVLATTLLASSGLAHAQFAVRGEVALATDLAWRAATPVEGAWTVAGHLAMTYDADAVSLEVVLDPSVRIGPTVAWTPGLTEAFAFASVGDADLSLGTRRQALETARLNVPFGVEAVDANGVRRGVLGARADVFLGAWRLRGAVFLDPRTGRLTPLVGARRSFGRFDVELHALHPSALVVGIGGSGLLHDLVVYAEAWWLTETREARAALGVSGSLPDGAWTLEAAYVPAAGGLAFETDVPAGTPGARPRPSLDGQATWALDAQGERSVSLAGGVAVGPEPDAWSTRVDATYMVAKADRVTTAHVRGTFGDTGATVMLGVGVRGFF